LADYGENPSQFAISAAPGQLDSVLAPLASDTVTTIVGFTELTDGGRLHNSAAVYHQGSILGVYRKLYPAINRSVYEAGDKVPIFRVGELTFGIVICNDSNHPEPIRLVAARGARAALHSHK
jgi:5-aminopentanamidase